MSKIDVIKKALLSNGVYENDVAVVATEKHHYIIHIFEMIVLVLCNFASMNKMTLVEIFNFMMSNFEIVVDIILTEIKQSIFYFDSIYVKEQQTDVIELHNKDECFVIVTIQDRVNKKLKRIM